MKAKKELSTGLALLGFLLPLAVLLTLIFQGVSIMLGLTAAICVEGLFGIYLGYSWDELEESAMKGIGRVNQTVIVMILSVCSSACGFPPAACRPCSTTA